MEATAAPAQPGRALNITAWVLAALLCALYLFAGVPKWTGAQQAVDGFRSMGFSDGFRIFIGVCETAGAIGLLIPRLAFWAALGLIPIMIGAVHTHLTHPEAGPPWGAGIALVLLCVVAYARRKQALFLS